MDGRHHCQFHERPIFFPNSTVASSAVVASTHLHAFDFMAYFHPVIFCVSISVASVSTSTGTTYLVLACPIVDFRDAPSTPDLPPPPPCLVVHHRGVSTPLPSTPAALDAPAVDAGPASAPPCPRHRPPRRADLERPGHLHAAPTSSALAWASTPPPSTPPARRRPSPVPLLNAARAAPSTATPAPSYAPRADSPASSTAPRRATPPPPLPPTSPHRLNNV
ncbi:vegetative cell wall protein gp1-like [Panicum virgatum]|uniref:vegetative cell wall protein gp1-like n=1 Tax=Panicum virgatum TaxID=38727 RepID=UPI0019D5FF2A|nr:vegetative cell wall protein gp1-like [Panicum virgatum]